jgi:hypothetical protein
MNEYQKEIEEVLDGSIRRNNGATTLHDCLNVLNDLMHFIHSQKLRISSEQNNFQEVM